MKHGLTMQSGMGMTVGVVFGGEGGEGGVAVSAPWSQPAECSRGTCLTVKLGNDMP